MSTDLVTVKQASALLVLLAAGGLRVPDVYHQPAEDGAPTGRVVMARMWAAALNKWGITYTEAEAAVSDYLAEPDAGQYPKAWPDPGKIIARTRAGRLAASLGSDADQAWHDFYRRLRSLFPHGPGKGMPLDEDDARDLAMAAGLRAIGGTSKVRDMTDEDRERFAAPKWKAAYVAERRRQAAEPREVRAMLTASEPKMLESGK